MTLPVRLKPVDRTLAQHPVERRGFVTVPVDPADASLGTFDIFYRVLPPHGSTCDDASKPFLVVINGGPGIASSFYRPLDFDYDKNAPPKGGLDRFKHLLADFRVVLADQRGTDGLSAPLDMDDPDLDPDLVARHFSSDSHARDTLALIEHLVPEGAPFYMIAQSYGGLPGMQYLALPNARRPHGIVFSSSALPFEDPATPVEAMRSRRREQLRLNLHLRAVVPDLEARLAATRAHYAALGLDPGLIHGLYVLLGKDVEGVWEPAFVQRLDTICRQSKAEILADIEAGLEAPNLLNYILSSANFSPGHTDRTLAALGSREIRFEPWMIDEHELLMSTGQDGTWRERLVARIDASPPPATPFPTMDHLREVIGRNQVLFTAADNDAFVPGDAYRETVSRFLVEGHTALRLLPGGHHAIFLEAGHRALLEWAAGLSA